MSVTVKDQNIKVIVNKVDVKNGGYGEIRFVSSRKSGENWLKSYFSFWTVRDRVSELAQAVENSGTFENSDNKKGVMIVIKAFSISQEKYTDKESKEQYSKQPKFMIWEWEFADQAKAKASSGAPVLPPEDDIPF